MIVHVARSAGFCFGVKRAVRMALEAAASGRCVRMLGDIVHNEAVIRALEAAGARKIGRLGEGRGKCLLIRAHGAGRRTLREARRRGYEIVDATCPMVHEIHRIAARMEGEGRRVVVVGDRRHDEVRGIAGQLRTPAIVVGAEGDVRRARFAGVRRAAVVVQSTQPVERALRVFEAVRALVPDVKCFNTVCRPTRTKQAEMQRMPLENDAMVIIGSRTSANTRRLYEIARALNARTHWVESAAELDPAWFKGVRAVGVGAGASTPDEVTRGVVAALRLMAAPCARSRPPRPGGGRGGPAGSRRSRPHGAR